jgi:hypothetical protein
VLIGTRALDWWPLWEVRTNASLAPGAAEVWKLRVPKPWLSVGGERK